MTNQNLINSISVLTRTMQSLHEVGLNDEAKVLSKKILKLAEQISEVEDCDKEG